MQKSVHKSCKKRKWGQGVRQGQGGRVDQAWGRKPCETKVIDVWWWWESVLVAGELLKMIQKSENEG
jgi:hypothetical protein